MASLSLRMQMFTRFWFNEDQVSALWDGGGVGGARGGADHYFLTDALCRSGICASRLSFSRQTPRRTSTSVLQRE